jgi:hypothetical protein
MANTRKPLTIGRKLRKMLLLPLDYFPLQSGHRHHRDIFNQQPSHAFSIALRCVRILPELAEIHRQSQEPVPLLRIQHGRIRSALAFILLLGFSQPL